MISEGKTLEPRHQFYYSRELYYNARYKEAIEGFTKFLDSSRGWIEDCISACRDLATCYYLINDEKVHYIHCLEVSNLMSQEQKFVVT